MPGGAEWTMPDALRREHARPLERLGARELDRQQSDQRKDGEQDERETRGPSYAAGRPAIPVVVGFDVGTQQALSEAWCSRSVVRGARRLSGRSRRGRVAPLQRTADWSQRVTASRVVAVCAPAVTRTTYSPAPTPTRRQQASAHLLEGKPSSARRGGRARRRPARRRVRWSAHEPRRARPDVDAERVLGRTTPPGPRTSRQSCSITTNNDRRPSTSSRLSALSSGSAAGTRASPSAG